MSTATVTGRVVDEQGALVNGAQIRMTAVDTGVVFSAATNTDGIYTLTNLPIGSYTLQAAVPGFQTYLQTGILLRVNDHVQINIAMKVGQVTESVDCTPTLAWCRRSRMRLRRWWTSNASWTCRLTVAI